MKKIYAKPECEEIVAKFALMSGSIAPGPSGARRNSFDYNDNGFYDDNGDEDENTYEEI